RSETHPQPDDTKFPFEKLPTELRLMVLQFTMPQHGLPPAASPCVISHRPTNIREYGISLTQLKEEDIVPTSLFRVSKWISAQALHIFNRTVYMHINISVAMIITGSEATIGLFLSQMSARQVQHMKCMRSYQINLRLPGGLTHKRAEYRQWLKERLRLTCDALMRNKDLQQLVVTFPCLCLLPSGVGWASQALSDSMDDLAPLERLHVVKPVTYLPAQETFTTTDVRICHQPGCLQLAHHVQAHMSRLDGEEPNDREKKWKRIKAIASLPRGSSHAGSLVKSFYRHLDSDSPEKLDARAEYTMEKLER
ncbi:MAG: hypothetical protein L6R42_011589, partial [Xanthoria sp. 1 TBL-2021]